MESRGGRGTPLVDGGGRLAGASWTVVAGGSAESGTEVTPGLGVVEPSVAASDTSEAV